MSPLHRLSPLHRWLHANPLPYLLVALVAFSGAAHAATFVVDKNDDTGGNFCTAAPNDCSLRDAINAANANTSVSDNITFVPSFISPIVLNSALPPLSDTVTITGPGANLLTVQASGSFVIFNVNSGISATLSGLTISNGLIGIRNQSGILTVTQCTLSNNSSAGISNALSGGTATMTHSTLRDNFAGFFANNSSVSTLTNCTMAGNTQTGMNSFGGSTITATNCTISANTQGIDSNSTVTLKNTICAGNAAVNINSGANLIQQGNNLISGNPMLGALANNGGPTLTMLPLTGSPAIDQGINSAPVTTDQRGQGRPFDQINIPNASSPAGAGDGSDIGAVEVQPAPIPCISINNVTITEGNSGTSNMTFTVTLSSPATSTVTVNYAIASGTATANSDYSTAFDSDGGTPGTLTIVSGTTGTITVPVVGDLLPEINETFFINLSRPTNATICDAQGIGTINNNDKAKLFISDVQMMEGDSNATPHNRRMYFTIALSGPLPTNVTVTYQTVNGTATTANNDYVPILTGTSTIPSGFTSIAVVVNIVGNTVIESNETFGLKLNSVTPAASVIVTKGTGVGTIVNDD